jgi:hypothetical protein
MRGFQIQKIFPGTSKAAQAGGKMNLRFLARGIAAIALFLASIPARAIDSGYSGAWFNPNQSGHGFTLDVLAPDHALVYWFVYDGQGNQMWLIVDGAISGSHISGPAYITKGMHFGSFNPKDNQNQLWGNVALDFTSCSSGTMSWQTSYVLNGFTFTSGSSPISRLSAIGGLKCGKRPASGLYTGFIVSPATPDGAEIAGLLDEQGQVTFLRLDGAGITLGSYSTSGSTVSMSATSYAAPGFANPDGSTITTISATAQYGEHDYITGTFSGGGTTGSVTLQYNPAYDRPSSPNAVAGNYTWTGNGNTVSLSISAAGVMTGSDTSGCQYNGTITPIDAQFDGYSVTVTFSNCGTANGTYSGVGVVADYAAFGDRRGLNLGIRSSSIALVRGFVRQ